MAIEIKQGLRLTQQLIVTPQLQQAIRLLQLSRLELTQLIQHELTENPVLEEEEEEQEAGEQASAGEKHELAKDEDKGHEHLVDEVGTKDGKLTEPANFDWENYLGVFSTPDTPSLPSTSEQPEELPSYETTVSGTESLQEHLQWQLHLSDFTDDEIKIGTEIIGNINDDGYLSASIEELAKKLERSEADIERVLKKIQQFDPPGIAARSVKECLMLQAALLGDEAPLISNIIDHYLSELELHNYQQIAKKEKLDIEKVKEIAKIISEMEPKPGRQFSQASPQYITPDVYIQKLGSDYEAVLNEDGLPKLTISNLYRRTLAEGGRVAPQTREYIQEKIKSAIWLIKSIQQRQQTLYKVVKSIIKFQRDFFDKGINYLKPLVLKDVAEDIGMHESTISRVTTNKYAHTPRGIFELKYFFNPRIKKMASSETVSSETVKNRIKQLIASEDPANPLSDAKLTEILKKDHGINVARRTVAKYREVLKHPSSARRKRIV